VEFKEKEGGFDGSSWQGCRVSRLGFSTGYKVVKVVNTRWVKGWW
jgi:hypothetical protein